MSLSKLISIVALGLLSMTAWSEEFQAGVHYEVLPVEVATANPDAVEVVEVFSYACIHCYNFDPMIEAWHEQHAEDGIDFSRMPAVFNPDWEILAQAFYAAETLQVGDAVHMPLFEGIHVKRQDLRQESVLADLFNDQANVAEADFSTVYNSFSVRSRVQQAKAKLRAYRITGVPSMVVNGKYRVDGKLAGSNTKMLQVVDYLVKLEQDSQKP